MDLKAKLLNASGVQSVPCPEIGETVFLRRMTHDERGTWYASIPEGGTQTSADIMSNQRLLVALTLCDADGKRLFETADEIKGIDGVLIERLSSLAMDMNVLSRKAQENAEKNS